MSIRFNVKRRSIMPTHGRIRIRPLIPEDWGPSNEPAERFAERGTINDPVGEIEDWGHLPSASV